MTVGSGARRMVIFVIGGVTRSEMRVVHTMSKQLNRDIILANTAVLRPNAFLGMLHDMGRVDNF
jgi:syntaxin-binding protein 1